MWRHSSDRSFSQTERPHAGAKASPSCAGATGHGHRFHNGAPGPRALGPLWAGCFGTQLRIVLAHAALALPHTGKAQLGAGFRARARQMGRGNAPNSGAGAGGSFPRTVPCLRAAKLSRHLIRGSRAHKLLNTHFQSWHGCSRGKHTSTARSSFYVSQMPTKGYVLYMILYMSDAGGKSAVVRPSP